MLTATALVCAGVPAHAQKGPPIIRDAETEQLLREYTQPILRSAGLAQQNVQVVIINDRSFNAFVADGRRIFVNGGALMESETPNQIIGVLAHETGHIAGGHLARLREALSAATTQSIIAMILGVGAMVAAGSSGNAGSGLGQAGAAAIAGPTQAIQNTMFGYMRQQEEQADRAGVKFLTATGQSPKGMYETFKRLADQMLYQNRYISPYMQSHPLPRERVAALEGIARASPYWDHKDPPALQARHDLMRAKLFGFLERPDAVARRYPPSDTSLAARYARAIAAYRYSDPRAAAASIDALIQAQPQNPYFYELKGQALLEAGKPAEAIAPLRHAVQLASNPRSCSAKRWWRRATAVTSTRRCRSCRRQSPASRKRPMPTAIWPWPMALRTILPGPISPPPRRPICVATSKPPARLPRAPRCAFRSDRPAGSRLTTSPA
jgi:predicted Zn-dependent protease